MADKVPLLLWSGGLDSTFLMWNLLQHSDVDFVVVSGGQRMRKMTAEAIAREKAMEYFAAHAPHKARELDSKLVMNMAEIPDALWSQPVPWLLGALGVLNHHHHSSVQVAYVLGDEIIGAQEYLQQAWRGLQGLSKLHAVPLRLPLAMTGKIRIMSMMPKGLYECIWYCENPPYAEEGEVFVPCGDCNPCIEHKTQLHKMQLSNRTVGMHAHVRSQTITPIHQPVKELV